MAGDPFPRFLVDMRYTALTILSLATLPAAPTLVGAQRPERDTLVRVEVRSWSRAQGREEISGELARQIERLARSIVEKRQLQELLSRQLEALEPARLPDAALAGALADSATRRRARRDLTLQLTGVARSVATMRQQLGSLCRRGERPDGWVGVTFEGAFEARGREAPEALHFVDFPAIIAVEPGSPAERAGLASGDVVLEIDRRDVRNRDIGFRTMLRPGARVPFRIRREGQVRDVTVTIGRRPETFSGQCHWLDATIALALSDVPIGWRYELSTDDAPGAPPRRVMVGPPGGAVVAPPAPPAPVRVRGRAAPPPRVSAVPIAPDRVEMSVTPFPPLPPLAVFPTTDEDARVLAGAEVTRLDAAWREALGIDQGVLVLRVARASPAERAGLRNGDVITEADRRRLTSPRVLARILGETSERQVRLQVVRKRRPMTVMLRW